MADRPEVLIVGGGVIGLAVARSLALRGAAVHLFERDAAPTGASWAAGGMLAPLGEARDAGPFLDFGLDALRRWPRWAEAVEAESGESVGFERAGKLLVAAGSDATARLRHRYDWQRADGHAVEWAIGNDVHRIEPALAADWQTALHLPDHAHVDPRRLLAALTHAARNAGAVLHHGASVAEVRREAGRVAGLRLDDGSAISGGCVVLAAGAWSGRIGGLPRPLPLRPVRGQMLAIQASDPSIAMLVGGPGAYLIPREIEGHACVVIGASMERAGFAVETDDATIRALRTAAEAMVPALKGRPEHSRWAGLRPGTPDDLPLLGADPEVAGLIYATGHHRNGILLAPGTAVEVSALVEGREIDSRWAEAFHPLRFDSPPPATRDRP